MSGECVVVLSGIVSCVVVNLRVVRFMVFCVFLNFVVCVFVDGVICFDVFFFVIARN